MHFAAQAANEKGWKYNSKRIKWAAQEFRNLQQPLTAEMLRKVFMVDDHPQIHYKECSCHGYHLREWAHCCTEWLTI